MRPLAVVPADPLANGGAFGGKETSPAATAARRVADETGRAVRVLFSRPDATRLGPKRPPVAGGADADGRGRLGGPDAGASPVPWRRWRRVWRVEEVDVRGPATSSADPRRGRGRGAGPARRRPRGHRSRAAPGRPGPPTAHVGESGDTIEVEVSCGHPLDEVVLRSYCIGAAHMAYSLVTSEAIAVDGDGAVADLTVRSFGVVPAARSRPAVHVRIIPSDAEPVNGSDAVFVAVAAATWLARGCPPTWPTDRGR